MPRLDEESIRRQKSTHFQATPRPCTCLKIEVLRAKNVTLGWLHDAFDTPDPYVTLRIPHSAEVFAKTKPIKDDKNPVWNETFYFHLDNHSKDAQNILEIALWDYDTFNADDKVGQSVFFELNNLPIEDTVMKTFKFRKSEVYVQFHAHYEKEAYHLRYGEKLCDEEQAFLEKRKPLVLEAMKKLLGERAPQNLDEVPNIAVLGSGGGYRATIGFTAACRALEEMQLMDCVTYLTGLSGSAWSLSLMYAQSKGEKLSPNTTHSHIREHLNVRPMTLFTPRKIMQYADVVKEKVKKGQPVSFTDVYGQIVGTHLMADAKNKHKLSDQQDNVKDGFNPLPIYTALNSKKDVSAEMVSEWVEFTPYEVGMDKYGTFMKTELFGSQFFCGKLVKQHPEPPLCYLQGIWGSFFAILIQRVLEEKQHLTDLKDDVIKQIASFRRSVSDDVRSFLRKNRESVPSSDSDDELPEDNLDSNTSKESAVKIEDAALDSTSPTFDDDDVFESPDTTKKSTLKKEKKNKADSQNVTQNTTGKRPNTAAEQKAVGIKALEYVMEKVPSLRTRKGRAGLVHNFLRGVALEPQQKPEGEDVPNSAEGVRQSFDKDNARKKKIELIDAGLQFNSPYPPVLRPERDVDLILSFDFSARDSDSVPPFKNLKLAEKWAKNHSVPFPPINDKQQFKIEGWKECYVFDDPTDDTCPIVMHFVLINKTFKQFKKPWIPRTTKAEVSEGSFAVFDDPSKCYSTFNLHYTNSVFDNLSKLVEFNTALNENLIKDTIAECVKKRRTAES